MGGVFHGPGHGLLLGGIEAAGLLVGLRHVVPHGGREAVPKVGVLLTPEAGPGQAAEDHQQQERRAPKPGDRVQVAPEQAPATAQAWPQDPVGRSAAWPPKGEAGHHQHHTPARREFDQAVASGADHQLAMQGTDDGLQVVGRVLLPEQVAAIGVDEHCQFVAGVVQDKLRAAAGVHRWQVFAEGGLGVGGLGALQLLVGAEDGYFYYLERK